MRDGGQKLQTHETPADFPLTSLTQMIRGPEAAVKCTIGIFGLGLCWGDIRAEEKKKKHTSHLTVKRFGDHLLTFHGGSSHLRFFMRIKSFLDLVLINVTESSDLRNKKLVGNRKKQNVDALTN